MSGTESGLQGDSDLRQLGADTLPQSQVRLEIRRPEVEIQQRIECPSDVVQLMASLRRESAEHLFQINLAANGQVNGLYLVGKGGADHAPCDVRECLKAALLSNSKRFILVHNHPSGDPTPSRKDLEVAQKVEAAAKMIDLQLQDMIIVGTEGVWSWRYPSAERRRFSS